MKRLINRLWRALVAPRMVYGWRHSRDGRWLAHTRISTATRIERPEQLDLGDHVYVGPFNLLDASGGLHIGEGCQITTHCALLSHSSHQALRLAGRAYWGHAAPPGLVSRAVAIGPYTFIGPHSTVMPGVSIGRGVLVRAYSYVDADVPDFAIVGGQPARVLGDTRDADRRALEADPAWQASYAAWAHPGDADA